MDNTVKIWDLETGTCLHTLMGHTSLVGLLGLSPNHLISAAADSSLRVWDADEMSIQHVLRNNGGAITCFKHDEHKVISGSDGMLKLWDIRRGKFVRDLIIGISSVWQVAVNGNLLVAASNRGGTTVFDIFDFGKLDHPSGVDNEDLDLVDWERVHPRESIAGEMRKKGHYYDWELDDTILAKEQADRDAERANSYDIAEDEGDSDEDDALELDGDGNPIPWTFKEPTVYTVPARPPRAIIIDTRPIKKKGIRKSNRISGKFELPDPAVPAPDTTPSARVTRIAGWKTFQTASKRGPGTKVPDLESQSGSPSALASSSKLPARSLSKVLGTGQDDKSKGKGKTPANAVASGSGTSGSRRAPPVINTRVTRSRSGPGSSSPAKVTRTSSAGQLSAPSRKRSFAPVFDDDEDDEVEEELEDDTEGRKGGRLLRAKKELDQEDELDSDSSVDEEDREGDDDMLGID
jgi:hypothetical protein